MADDIFGGEEAQSTPVDISDLVTTTPLPSVPLPLPATRNQAVKTALVADPVNSQEHYNTMMNEAAAGQSTTQQALKQQAQVSTDAYDRQSVAELLSDSSVDFATKQRAVQGFAENRFRKDTGVMLQSNLLAKESKGETPDAEVARISTADAMGEIADSRAKIQTIVNGFKEKADATSPITAFFDAAAGFIPFRNQIETAQVMNDVAARTGIPRAWWETFNTYARPGTDIKKLQAHVASLPPDQQVTFAKALAESVQAKSGFLYGNDNQHEAFEFMNKVFNTESYGAGSEFLDNLAAAGDLFFVGSTIKDIGIAGRNIARMVTGNNAPVDVNEARQFAQANANTPSNVKAEPTGAPSGVVNDVAEPTGDAYKVVKDVAEPSLPAAKAEEFVGPEGLKKPVPSGEIPNPGAVLGGSGRNLSQFEAKNTPALLRKGNVEAITETMDRIKVNSAVHGINPASPMEIAQNANPASARQMHEAVVKGTDEVAEALTGTDQTQAIINNTMPQHSNTGTVFSRVGDVDQNLRVEMNDPNLVDLVNGTSANAFTPSETAIIRGRVAHDFANNTGMQMNENMSAFKWDGVRASIHAVYDLPAGSWSKPEEAMEQAKYALRHYGIDDADITLLRKDGVNHTPVSLDEVRGVEGDYKIQVKSNYEMNRNMLDDAEKLTVKRNWADRFAGTHTKWFGSLQRNLIDAASSLHPVITGSASVAKDYGARFEKYLLKKAADYSDSFSKLPKTVQAQVDDYVREANFRGIGFDQADLAARGFGSAAVDVIRKWRNFWDDHFALENLDVVRTLRGQGYEYFKNANAELYARPLGKIHTVQRFYDPATDTVRGFNAGELDALYDTGGHLSKLRRPAAFGGETVEHMIVRQTPTEYSRALRDSDRILNYKQGYYTITYKAAKYVDEVDADGKTLRTVAVAGDTQEAEQFAARHRANNPGTLTRVRNDNRAYRADRNEYWDVESMGGRIAQRHRGKLLEDASAPNRLGDMKYIENPNASAVKAARSISGRTVMRPVLETASDRFMKAYKDVLPKDKYGQVRWPQNAEEIGRSGETSTKQVADARTTWEYINFLRNGYINSLDDGVKAVFNSMADTAGSKGHSLIERGLRGVGEFQPTNFARRTAFNLYLATHPLRQLIVQSTQAYRMIVYNPIDFVNGKIPADLGAFLGVKAGQMADTKFTKFLEESGLVAAVDHHNLTASSLTSLADESNKVVSGINKGFDALRTIGFDAGETINIVSHASAVFRRYERLGRDLANKDVREQAFQEIRALSYNMNAAGDMPYNQTSAAALFQFMQMPHKALLQLTNRQLDVSTRAKLLVGDMLLWGTAIDRLSDAVGFDFLPADDTVGNKVLHDGMVSVGYNALLKKIWPDTKDIDFSSLAPIQIDGWAKLFTNKAQLDLLQAISNSPAGSFLKSNGKFGQVFSDMARVFSPMEYDDRNVYERFQTLVSDVAKLSSGWSAADKARLMVEAGKRRDQYNNIVSDNTTTGDVIAQLFGFGDRQVADNYHLGEKLKGDVKARKDEVLARYNDIKRYIASQYAGDNVPDFQYMTAVTGAALQIYKDKPDAMEIINQQMKNDLSGPDQDLMFSLFKSMNIPGSTDIETQIARGPWDESTKEQMRQAYSFAKNAQEHLTDQVKGN